MVVIDTNNGGEGEPEGPYKLTPKPSYSSGIATFLVFLPSTVESLELMY